ncbi:response regulator [Ramlibacter aquaticus]|uniref:Response regulator n=1 Tax=Ramlibacter aquaticus TaxID=2780094 RepID=A0ABR9SBF4_9BURK|nr:response regulator [Ramlibacter aquaticus]MBE7939684.1 response regulator [Ramlibacter aquaticus]
MRANLAVIVEDDPGIRRFVRTALEAEGWRVEEAGTLQEGARAVESHEVNLLLVDLGLPDGDGIELIRQVRGRSSVPLIVLSARAGEQDKIDALDAGADDYLTKPFGVGEMLARVRANLRRPRAGLEMEAAGSFRFGDVEIDREARIVRRGGQDVHLTPIEYRLLSILVANAGRVLTHRQLLQQVWGGPHAEQTHYVRIYMGHLRSKLEADPAKPRHLLTETAIGYRLIAD